MVGEGEGPFLELLGGLSGKPHPAPPAGLFPRRLSPGRVEPAVL